MAHDLTEAVFELRFVPRCSDMVDPERPGAIVGKSGRQRWIAATLALLTPPACGCYAP